MSDKLECHDGSCVMTDDHSGMRTTGRCKCIENACTSHSEARQIWRRMMTLIQRNRELTRELEVARADETVCERFEALMDRHQIVRIVKPIRGFPVVTVFGGEPVRVDTLAVCAAKLKGE